MRGYLNQSTGDTYFLATNDRLTESSIITQNQVENNVAICLESMKIASYQDGRSLNTAQQGKDSFNHSFTYTFIHLKH